MCLSETLAQTHDHPDQRVPVTRRGALLGAAAAALTVALPAPAQAAGHGHGHQHRRGRVADLTHVFRAGFPVYTGDPPSRRTVTTIPADGYYSQAWTFAEHSGTHLDAPGHFVAGRPLVDQLDPDDLIAAIVVIDIARRAARDPDAQVQPADLVAFERRHGRIPRHALVCMHSGWERRVGDPDAYRNPGPDGLLHFPGFSLAAVEWLLERRDIVGIGVDTLSLDFGASTTFDVHRVLLGTGRYGLENLARLRRIPPRGAEATVGVIPWQEGSGGPCRVLARW